MSGATASLGMKGIWASLRAVPSMRVTERGGEGRHGAAGAGAGGRRERPAASTAAPASSLVARDVKVAANDGSYAGTSARAYVRGAAAGRAAAGLEAAGRAAAGRAAAAVASDADCSVRAKGGPWDDAGVDGGVGLWRGATARTARTESMGSAAAVRRRRERVRAAVASAMAIASQQGMGSASAVSFDIDVGGGGAATGVMPGAVDGRLAAGRQRPQLVGRRQRGPPPRGVARGAKGGARARRVTALTNAGGICDRRAVPARGRRKRRKAHAAEADALQIGSCKSLVSPGRPMLGGAQESALPTARLCSGRRRVTHAAALLHISIHKSTYTHTRAHSR